MTARALVLLALLALASCTQILGLDIEYVGAPQGGAGGHGGAGAGPTTGGGGSGAMGGGGGCALPLAAASDSFADGSDDGWCRLVDANPNDAVVLENEGVVVSTVNSEWFETSYGPFFYREIAQSEGNFVVVAGLEVTDGGAMPPDIDGHGGGLLVRRPNATPGTAENHVLFSLADVGNGFGARWWSTDNGTSTSPGWEFSTDYVALAICRYDTTFYFFAFDGAATVWDPILPGGPPGIEHLVLANASTLQVGLAAHASSVAGLVEVDARYVDFYPVRTTCEAALPTDPAALE